MKQVDHELHGSDAIPRTPTIEDIDASLPAILTQKYPAKAHCLRLAKCLKDRAPQNVQTFLLMPSARSRLWPDCDQEQPFRQHRDFFWLTGCKLPDCMLIYDVHCHHLTLVIPPVDLDDVLWSGMPMTKGEAQAKYDVDMVITTDELAQNPSMMGERLALISDANLYGREEPRLKEWWRQTEDCAKRDVLLEAEIPAMIGQLRVVKDAHEVALIRRANQISEIAHLAVIREIGAMKNERDAYSVFLQQCTIHAAKDQAYEPIVAGGCDAATLHYVHNDKDLTGRELMLLDAGCEVDCYASDVTRTYPIRGSWSALGRKLYSLVYKMQTECIKMLREGVIWEDVHCKAHDIAHDGLINDLQILRANAPRSLTSAFFPHGLGHYLGLDTHDTGGNADYTDPDLMFRYLRVRGALPAQSVITVEPGIYFCKFIIDKFLADPSNAASVDQEVLANYYPLGGVRIEDDLLVTEHGSVNLTTVPKGLSEMERRAGSG